MAAARELLLRLGSPDSIRLATPTNAGASVTRLELHLDTLDTTLGGGFPRGRLSEIVGTVSSGKTALLYALLATVTARGEAAALVDLADAFSPSAAAGAGIDLSSMLWVRPTSLRDTLRCAELLLDTSGFGAVAIDIDCPTPGRLGAGAWLRLARATERSKAVVIVLARERVAGTCATLGLAMRPLRRHWNRRGSGPTLFDGLDAEVSIIRNRIGIPQRAATLRMAAA